MFRRRQAMLKAMIWIIVIAMLLAFVAALLPALT